MHFNTNEKSWSDTKKDVFMADMGIEQYFFKIWINYV